MTKNDRKRKWQSIMVGELKDDYTNHALSHFGFLMLEEEECSFHMIKGERDVYRPNY